MIDKQTDGHIDTDTDKQTDRHRDMTEHSIT